MQNAPNAVNAPRPARFHLFTETLSDKRLTFRSPSTYAFKKQKMQKILAKNIAPQSSGWTT